LSELVFLKLGGSLITDKRRYETARPEVIERVAGEIATALNARPEMRLIIGHGSGSYGHFAADRFKVGQGNLDDWRGYAETAAAAQRLNRMVTDALLSAGVSAVSMQPSASGKASHGSLVHLDIDPIAELLEHGLVPLVYGDVCIDEGQGCCIISTEQVFVYLAHSLRPQRIIEAGEVAGVYTGDPQRDSIVRLLPEITSRNYGEIEGLLSSSFGVDVTGGMLAKVRDLFALVQRQPNLTVRIVSGRRGKLVERVLVDPENQEGTLLRY